MAEERTVTNNLSRSGGVTHKWLGSLLGATLSICMVLPAHLANATEQSTASAAASSSTALSASTPLSDAETVSAALKRTRAAVLKKITNDTASFTEDSKVFSWVSSWQMLALTRDDANTREPIYQRYYNGAVEVLKKYDGKFSSGSSRPTDTARYIIALTALGYDAQNIEGYNLFDQLTSLNVVTRQGSNAVTYVLIAWELRDSYSFVENTEEGADPADAITVPALVDALLASRSANHSWMSDPDRTAMAIQSLAPLQGTEYDTGGKITTAVAEATDFLGGIQLANGGYKSFGAEYSNSAAQVLTALAACGISVHDSRFIKAGGTSVLQALLAYEVSDGGFMSMFPTGSYPQRVDVMATEQAYYALVAYSRFLNGQNGLFDMSDIALENGSTGTDAGAGTGTDSGAGNGTDSGDADGAGTGTGTDESDTTDSNGSDSNDAAEGTGTGTEGNSGAHSGTSGGTGTSSTGDHTSTATGTAAPSTASAALGSFTSGSLAAQAFSKIVIINNPKTAAEQKDSETAGESSAKEAGDTAADAADTGDWDYSADEYETSSAAAQSEASYGISGSVAVIAVAAVVVVLALAGASVATLRLRGRKSRRIED